MRTFVFSCLMFIGPLAQAETWSMDENASSLRLVASVYGAPFEAEFASFDADIVFDPTDLSGSSVTARIDLADIVPAIADDAVYISELQGADWFFSSKFPQAIFESQRFSDLGKGTYKVDGILAIRDKATPISFDFDLSIDGDQASMMASVEGPCFASTFEMIQSKSECGLVSGLFAR